MSKYLIKPITSIYLDPINGINSLKRDLLLYDYVGALNVDSLLSGLHLYKQYEYWQNALNEVEYLIKEGKFIELKSLVKPGSVSVDNYNLELANYTMELQKQMGSTKEEEEYKRLSLFKEHDELNTRLWCSIANASNDAVFTVPSLNDNKSFELPKTTKEKAYTIIHKHFPLPAENTPWEKIFEFNNDSESRLKLLSLRNWMNELPANIKQEELEDKISYQIYKYTENLKQHKISTKVSTIKTIVKVIPSALAELVRLKFDKAIDAFFSIAEQKVNFQNYKDRSNLSGNELAYISHVNSAFKSQGSMLKK